MLGDGLLNPGYFDWKDRFWTQLGVNMSGIVPPGFQWGSNDGKLNCIYEFLFLVDWEVWREDKSAGRLITEFAHDRNIGSLGTRAFANWPGSTAPGRRMTAP